MRRKICAIMILILALWAAFAIGQRTPRHTWQAPANYDQAAWQQILDEIAEGLDK